MNHVYKTKGVCATNISFDVDERDTVTNISFTNGCDGNLKMLSLLLGGKNAVEIIALCKGTTCDKKKTSCADQLALAVEEALAKDVQSTLS